MLRVTIPRLVPTLFPNPKRALLAGTEMTTEEVHATDTPFNSNPDNESVHDDYVAAGLLGRFWFSLLTTWRGTACSTEYS